jgi:hypothetical protein
MADPVDYRYNQQGQPVPVYQQASPGIGGAISDAIKALAMAFAPKSITQRKPAVDQAVAQADPSASSLGNQF